jgi:impB/mucB/samB family protein
MNYAVLFVFDFSLQALRRSNVALVGKSVALTRGEGRKACITERSQEASGIEPGLAVTLAMARCPGLIILPPDATAEAEASRLLLAAAFTLSPRVERTATGVCTIDLQGLDETRIEAQMRTCVAELAASGLQARAGAAANPLLALYAAQHTDSVLAVRTARSFLASLPLTVAVPTTTHAAVLQGWGVKTLGDLTALPKAEIGQRLGTDGVLLWERAAGEATRVLRLIEPSRTFVAEWEYDPPVESMEPLLFRLRRFADCVALELRGASVVAEKLTLVLRLEDDTEHQRDFRLPEASTDVDGWIRILHAHLETVRTSARVMGVRLLAQPARPTEKQDGLFDVGLKDPAAFWENLARLGAIVGDDRVGTPMLLDTWRPDAVALERPPETVPAPAEEPVHPPRGLTLRRFRPPLPADVLLTDARPASLTARDFSDTIRFAHGPFRWSGSWWKPNETWQVEVWQVQTEKGVLYQLSRTLEGWCVEGVLD